MVAAEVSIICLIPYDWNTIFLVMLYQLLYQEIPAEGYLSLYLLHVIP